MLIESGDDGMSAGGDHVRQVVPGGWRRVLFALAVGAALGAVIGLILPRDDGPRRTEG
ncbi:MAG: hypothetical protein R6U94_02355 [Nitriliruptoraceae bacterium]